jgi:hypothetical protein
VRCYISSDDVDAPIDGLDIHTEYHTDRLSVLVMGADKPDSIWAGAQVVDTPITSSQTGETQPAWLCYLAGGRSEGSGETARLRLL